MERVYRVVDFLWEMAETLSMNMEWIYCFCWELYSLEARQKILMRVRYSFLRGWLNNSRPEDVSLRLFVRRPIRLCAY